MNPEPAPTPSPRPDNETINAIARLDGNSVSIIGNRVYDASQLVPSIVYFTRSQYLFLNNYRLGITIDEAAAKSGMTVEDAEKFLSRPKTVAWLQDRAVKDHIRNEWAEGGKWWEMGNECLEGRKHLSKDQQIVFMAFGDRVCPKVKEADNERGKTVINFNFSPEAVKEAFTRQSAIDAEISK